MYCLFLYGKSCIIKFVDNYYCFMIIVRVYVFVYTIIVEITPKSLNNKNGLSVTDPVSR